MVKYQCLKCGKFNTKQSKLTRQRICRDCNAILNNSEYKSINPILQKEGGA